MQPCLKDLTRTKYFDDDNQRDQFLGNVDWAKVGKTADDISRIGQQVGVFKGSPSAMPNYGYGINPSTGLPYSPTQQLNFPQQQRSGIFGGSMNTVIYIVVGLIILMAIFLVAKKSK